MDKHNERRPGSPGRVTTTPGAGTLVKLLGGTSKGSVLLSTDEMKAINKLYGLVPEQPNTKPSPPMPPVKSEFKSIWDYDDAVREHKLAMERHAKWKDPRPFYQAGADRNALRHAQEDGLRMLAWIARYIPTGADPLKTLVQIAADSGFDVDPDDIEWANTEKEDEPTEAEEVHDEEEVSTG